MASPDPRLTSVTQQIAAGRYEQAKATLLRLLRHQPNDADLNNTLAAVLIRLNGAAQALFYARRAHGARPHDRTLTYNLAKALIANGLAEEAAAVLEAGLSRSPADIGMRRTLGRLLVDLDRLDDAVAVCLQGLELVPGDTDVMFTYTVALRKQGRVEEATPLLRSLQWQAPRDIAVAESLACLLNFDPGATPEELAAAHEKYGHLLEQYAEPSPFRHAPTDDPERPLRVGLLSHDFVQHSVSYFAEPVIAHLDRARFRVVCYHTGLLEDAMTARLRSVAPEFRHLPGIGAVALAQRIHADRIDVLVELNGLYTGHRLHTMQLRPAPVQVTYIGYANTTGVRAIDYRIVDSLTDPPGSERYAVEELVRLDPCFLCYRPHPEAPPPRPDARTGDGPITFGSFNMAIKVNRTVVQAWARVLHAVPESRLLLKAIGLSQPRSRRVILDQFAAAGVGPERLELLPWVRDAADHFATYDRVDIALDTFPYNGTTTTCEALLMGVPVVTIAGRTHAGRVGVSLLTSAGLKDQIATDIEGYVRAAVSLATDRARLRAVRAGLRSGLLGSALCDGAGFGQRLGDAIRDMWRRRCRDGVRPE